MAYKMGDLRNLDHNLYNFIASGISSNGYTILSGYDDAYVTSGIYLVDAFPENPDNLKVPAISVDHRNTSEAPLQLGTGREDRLKFRIDVYGRSKGERDDVAEMVRLFFKTHMPILDYNQIIQDSVTVQIGSADFENVTMFPVNGDSVQRALKHRMSINLDCLVVIPSGTSLIT